MNEHPKNESRNDIMCDFQVDVGRADLGRTFVRVVHLPSGKERVLIGLGGSTANAVAEGLAKEILLEIGSGNR